jgi:hypothetical protein
MAVSVTQVQRYTVGGSIYKGVTKPADFTLMTHAAGVPTGGTDVGATTGVATFEYKPTISMTDIEQVFGQVAPRMTAESATLKFTCVEATYLNLAMAAQMATPSTDGSHNILKVGGRTDITPQCVAIVAKNADSGLFHWVCIYNAVSMDGLAIGYKRGEPRQVSVTMTAIPDVARSVGDQLAQYNEETF